MPENSTPPPNDATLEALKELARRMSAAIEQIARSVSETSQGQREINRAMAGTLQHATAEQVRVNEKMTQSIESLDKTVSTQTKTHEVNSLLLVVLAGLSFVIVAFVILRALAGNPAAPEGSLTSWPVARWIPMAALLILTVCLGGWRGKGDPLVIASGVATILSFIIALAQYVGEEFGTGSPATQLTVGFALVEGGGGTQTVPPILIGPFAPGSFQELDKKVKLDELGQTCQPTTDRDLKEQVCAARTELAETSLAIIIGRHDRQPLKRKAEQHLYSNSSLAQSRADEVARLLAECAPFSALPRIITSVGSPRVVMGKGTACDRTVEIVALKRATN